MRILLASNNNGKLREMRELLVGHEIVTMRDIGLEVDVVEDGETFYDNALLKAREISILSGMPTLADDSGLVVPALGGAPGIHSARYSGMHGRDVGNNALLLANMVNVVDRSAYFISCVVLYLPSGIHYSAEGRVYGHILTQADGCGGFGYDPLFYSDELAMSFGSASSADKNKVSHRARAIAALSAIISTIES